MKEKGVLIRYLMILCWFKMLMLLVIIWLQIEQELVRSTPIRRAQYVILVLSRHWNICRPLCPTTLKSLYYVGRVQLILTLKLSCRLNKRLHNCEQQQRKEQEKLSVLLAKIPNWPGSSVQLFLFLWMGCPFNPTVVHLCSTVHLKQS